ncbi:MAG: metal-dependent hydrolase [Thermococcus sp.]|uniref:Hydrolase n=1 Tax=Thermococcus guaymasensis DSM 11113 TaxID=1432656 RepID=A0A0X1KJX5_9EURY|nr:metal-dependent hydrolase [Thermococcus guaymasensis]AJC71574.1 hydrolase [Thermococcus guaymasensis DSM 11113]MCD6525039.1 metal-dependent hydrolase [Thermococcus sp.]
MPNYDTHVLSGVATYPIAVLLGELMKTYLNLPLKLTPIALVLGYAFYVLGSDLPDMDHPNALIHRGSKPIVSVAAGSAIFLWASDKVSLSPEWLSPVVAWVVGAVAGLAGWYLFTVLMPKHRGVVHSLLFATVYGLLAFILVGYGLTLSPDEGLYVGLAAFLGYTLHLLLDGSLKLI